MKPDKNEFHYPLDKNKVINLKEKETIELFCSATKKTTATCGSDGEFMINSESNKLKTYKCDEPVKSVIRKVTDKKCNTDKTLLEGGFDLGNDKFIKLFEICHDGDKESNLWVNHQITPANFGFQSNVASINFDTPPGLYNARDVNSDYKKDNQLQTFTKLLGSEKLAEDFYQESKNLFLSRGHLAAKTDFIFGSQQLATFWVANIAPQWQSFNGGNWEKVEVGVRKLAADRDLNLNIYTGTYGVMKTLDSSEPPELVELYLYIYANNKTSIPVPQIYYKVIIDTKSNDGVVIVGVNNPFIDEAEIKKSYMFCDDVADKIKWIEWEVHNIEKGYMYACEVGSFTKEVTELPDLTTVKGLLV